MHYYTIYTRDTFFSSCADEFLNAAFIRENASEGGTRANYRISYSRTHRQEVVRSKEASQNAFDRPLAELRFADEYLMRRRKLSRTWKKKSKDFPEKVTKNHIATFRDILKTARGIIIYFF